MAIVTVESTVELPYSQAFAGIFRYITASCRTAGSLDRIGCLIGT